jgi:hypothetical protein
MHSPASFISAMMNCGENEEISSVRDGDSNADTLIYH